MTLGRTSIPLRIKTTTSKLGIWDLFFLKDSLIRRFTLFRLTAFEIFFLLTTKPNLDWFLCLMANMRMKRQETLYSALLKTLP